LGRRPKQPKAVKRRKNSQNPPEVKQPQRNRAELLLLLEEEPRDQKAAEHEEDQHAVATRRGREAQVVKDDQEYGHHPQAVQPGQVGRGESFPKSHWQHGIPLEWEAPHISRLC